MRDDIFKNMELRAVSLKNLSFLQCKRLNCNLQHNPQLYFTTGCMGQIKRGQLSFLLVGLMIEYIYSIKFHDFWYI